MKKSTLRATAALQALALLGAGAGAAFIAAPASAQDYTRGNLLGQVTDDKGTPISGATVTVTSNEQGFTTTTTTDANGNFRASSLPNGTYTVIVQVGGNTVVEDRGVRVIAGQNNQFAYTAGAPTQAADQTPDDGVIVVTGTRVQVNDFASTQTGANLDVEELAKTVPVARNQNALMLLAPGAVEGDNGFGGEVSIGGATVAENTYFVNGLNVTNFRNFIGGGRIPFEFYRSLDVKTGGYAAEFGRALGGVTSAVTKSGSNKYEGGVVVSYSPNWLSSNSPDTYASYNREDYAESVDASMYLSGPILKDRVFFYGLYQPRWAKSGGSSITSRFRATTTSDTPFWGGKLDANITDGHRLEFTLFSDEQKTKTAYEHFNTPATGPFNLGDYYGENESEFGGKNWIGMYTGRFTDWLTLSLAHGRYNDKLISNETPDVATITNNRANGGVLIPVTLVQGTNGSTANQKDVRKVNRADLDLYVNLLGEHHFRFGIDKENLFATAGDARTGGYASYAIRRTANPLTGNELTLTTSFYKNDGGFKSKQTALYAQDNWKLLDGRLNLQLGVRGDNFKNYTINGEKFYDNDYTWAPRLGASFDVFGDNKTKINAFYGKYTLPIATNTNIRLGGAELFYGQRYRIGAGGGSAAAAAAAADLNGNLIPDILEPYIDPTTGNVDLNAPVLTNVSDDYRAGAGSPLLDCPPISVDAGEPCYTLTGDGTAKDTATLVSQTLKPSQQDEFILGATHRMKDWTFGVAYTRRRLLETLEDSAIDAAAIDYCVDGGYGTETECYYVWTGYHQYVLANPGSPITVALDAQNSSTGAYIPELDGKVITLTPKALGYEKAVRKYDAVQFTVDKAFNGFYGFNGSYTYTKLRGNFEGGVKSDNNQDDTGLTQDFDQPGFQEGAYGDLANGRKHSFKLYGHVQPIKWLDIGLNAVIESPRNFSCIGNYRNDGGTFEYYYGAASYWCQQPSLGTPNENGSVLVPRGTAFKSSWTKRFDLGFGFKPFGEDSALSESLFRVDIFNVLNSHAKTDFNEFGDISLGGPNPDYGKVTGFQAPRSVRLTAAMRFGQK